MDDHDGIDLRTRVLIGIGALVAAVAHTFTDVLEAAQGGFSVPQLALNYAAFLILPFVTLGLHAVQRERSGWTGLVGALAYGASFVYFAGTTTYALARATPDYATLLSELGLPYTLHGALMVVGGALFGTSVVRAGILPRWTGLCLLAGVGVNLLVALVPAPPLLQIAGSALRNVAFAGMGVAVLRTSRAALGNGALRP